MIETQRDKLIQAAIQVAQCAYAPYSHYLVGSAVYAVRVCKSCVQMPWFTLLIFQNLLYILSQLLNYYLILLYSMNLRIRFF